MDNRALLKLEHVARSYQTPSGKPVPVLRDVCLDISSGESVAVTGPSGSGKSTLLNIIGALDQPSDGTIVFDGRDLSTLSDRDLSLFRSRHIGFVFQLHHLLPQCTVIENVLVPTMASRHEPSPGASIARARDLIDRVGLADRVDYMPSRLSGGECQRVALARALINRPRLLLADEPTGSLDHATADKLASLLMETNKEENLALVVVTHDPALAHHMSRRYSLADGCLVVDG